MTETLLIRADAGLRIGTGHIMRCLALAQAWQEHGNIVHFVLATKVPSLETRLISENMVIHHLAVHAGSDADATQTANLAHQIGAHWVVVDGYQFDTAYQQFLKQAGLLLLFVDDYGHAHHYCVDLVLNQNISADEMFYASRDPYTQLLLGPEYALLRCEFWPWQKWERKITREMCKVLVTMGGSDPDNVTLKVMQALKQANKPDLIAKVVVGSTNPNLEKLQQETKEVGIKLQLLTNVTNMPELMAWADMAISAGGSTCGELAFMGVPTLIIEVADNQKLAALAMETHKVAVNAGESKKVSKSSLERLINELMSDYNRRRQLSKNGKMLFDGSGAKRVVTAMTSYQAISSSTNQLTIQKIDNHDFPGLSEVTTNTRLRP